MKLTTPHLMCTKTTSGVIKTIHQLEADVCWFDERLQRACDVFSPGVVYSF